MRNRQIRFDINCQTKNGELINVEMSFNPDPFEPVRLEFHAAKLFSGQDIKSKMDRVVEKPIGEMNAVEHWGIFFQYLTDMAQRRKINQIIECEEGIAMASEILMTISKDEAEKERLRSEYKYQLDLQSKLVHAKRQGILEGRISIARNLLSLGDPIEKIITVTGLTREEVENLT